ncbi:MAG: helicase-associated domain-containing protein, partial [Firmicutes bacterium]|nr:helicase-associated domain-containing protein [Bacillota bacterium]
MPVGLPLAVILTRLPEPHRRRLWPEAPARRLPARRLAERLQDPDGLARRVAALPETAREFLRRLLFSGGQAAADRVQAVPDAYTALNALAETGLVFLVRADYYRMLYLVPQEFLEPLWRALVDPGRLPVTTGSESPRPIPPAPAFTPFWADLLLLLGAARWEHLPLTQQATVYKRALNRLIARSALARDRQRAAVQMELVLRFALENRLVFKDPGGPDGPALRLTGAVPAFLALPPAARWARLLDFAAGGDPLAGPMPQVTLMVAASLPPQAWIDLGRLDKWLRSMALQYLPPGHLPEVLEEWAALDLWEWGPDRRSGRLSALGYAAANGPYEVEESGRILCQTTGEVLVPPVTPALERWQLEEVARLERPDRVSVYRLDQAAAERAIDNGYSLEQVLDLLRHLAPAGVPQNVAENLRDWFAALTRHRLVEAM